MPVKIVRGNQPSLFRRLDCLNQEMRSDAATYSLGDRSVRSDNWYAFVVIFGKLFGSFMAGFRVDI